MISKWENEHYDYPQLSVFYDLCSTLDFVSKIDVSKIDQDILLYIHIPFCISKCIFCNYYKISNFTNDLFDRYFECLKKEIKYFAQKLPLNMRKLQGIQFGGGTPSVVPAEYYEELFACIFKFFSIDDNATISFEGNIKSLNSKAYIKRLKQIGINRVSFGVQSFKQDVRRKWGLMGTVKEIDQLIELLQMNDIDDYNIDLMYNFSNQTIYDTLEDINLAFSKNVKTIDLYSLIVFPNTNMSSVMIRDGKYEAYKSGESVLKYSKMYEILAADPSIHFMMSNTISKSPMCSYKNLHIQLGKNKLNGGTIIGVGASARGFIGGVTYKNHVDITEYINNVINFGLGVNMANKLSEEEIENKLLVMFPNFTFLDKKDLSLSSYNRSRLTELVKSGIIKENDEKYYISKADLFWAGRISSVFFSKEQKVKMTKSVLINRKKGLNMYNQDYMNIAK